MNQTYHQTLSEFDFQTSRTLSNKLNWTVLNPLHYVRLGPAAELNWTLIQWIVSSCSVKKICLIKVVLLCMWSQNMKNTCSELTSTSKNWIDLLIFNTSFTEKTKVQMSQTFDLVQLFIILQPKQVHCYCYKSQSIHQHHQFCKYLLLQNAALQELPLHIHVVASYPLQKGRTGSTSFLTNFYCIQVIMTWYDTMFWQLLEQ